MTSEHSLPSSAVLNFFIFIFDHNSPKEMTSKIQLLKSAIPQIPTHGFTINSFLSSSSTPTASPNESVIRSFFPGRPSEKTSPERSLFRAWDDHQSDLLSNDTQNPSSEFSSEKVDRRFAYERTVSILEKRLLESWNVRSHLSQVSLFQRMYIYSSLT